MCSIPQGDLHINQGIVDLAIRYVCKNPRLRSALVNNQATYCHLCDLFFDTQSRDSIEQSVNRAFTHKKTHI